ncbi:MAG: hypothetical protein J6A62_07350 [Oscillospiraceae bacterium]|nr:hypothetical protein [Oscillospiraceae bacterium]
MYKGKRLQATKYGTGRNGKKAAVLLSSAVVFLALAVGTSVAFIVAGTRPITNIFTPSKVSCQVNEKFDGVEKREVTIANTGDTQAYIRAAIVVTWKDAAGNIYAGKPEEGADKDYTITLNATDWVKGSDGFYYHKKPIDADQSTAVLVEHCAPIEGKTPDGYSLNVEILGSAIQSVPATTVEDSWGVTVTDGEISK